MMIAQITDLHLGMSPPEAGALNAARLDAVIDDLLARDVRPDLLVVSGDLTDGGQPHAYDLVRARFDGLPIPTHFLIGNHDRRANFLAAFPGTPIADGFVQYAIELPEFRILALDTLEEGRHGGGFCEVRARWLADRLAETPGRPTVVICHHPPFATGIDWMTSDACEPWRVRLETVLAGSDAVVAVLSGHIHRAIVVARGGRTFVGCPSVAPQVALCLQPIDPAIPDGRPLVTTAPPGYALHCWSEGGLLTHFVFVEEVEALARFTPETQDFIAHQIAERMTG